METSAKVKLIFENENFWQFVTFFGHFDVHSSLAKALKKGDQEMVEMVSKFYSLNEHNMFIFYCYAGDAKKVVQIERKSNQNLKNSGIYGAALGGQQKIVNKMFEKGADLNFALSGSCHRGDLRTTEWLIRMGANKWNEVRFSPFLFERVQLPSTKRDLQGQVSLEARR